MLGPKMTVHLDGPFFGPRDPAKTVRENIRDMLDALAREGEADVRDHSPSLHGHFRAGIRGRVESLTGRRWALHAVISQTYIYPWDTKGGRGFSGRAQADYRGGKLEGKYHMFRDTAKRLRGMRAVTGANLTKGLE